MRFCAGRARLMENCRWDQAQVNNAGFVAAREGQQYAGLRRVGRWAHLGLRTQPDRIGKKKPGAYKGMMARTGEKRKNNGRTKNARKGAKTPAIVEISSVTPDDQISHHQPKQSQSSRIPIKKRLRDDDEVETPRPAKPKKAAVFADTGNIRRMTRSMTRKLLCEGGSMAMASLTFVNPQQQGNDALDTWHPVEFHHPTLLPSVDSEEAQTSGVQDIDLSQAENDGYFVTANQNIRQKRPRVDDDEMEETSPAKVMRSSPDNDDDINEKIQTRQSQSDDQEDSGSDIKKSSRHRKCKRDRKEGEKQKGGVSSKNDCTLTSSGISKEVSYINSLKTKMVLYNRFPDMYGFRRTIQPV